jgi:hypothetical protein
MKCKYCDKDFNTARGLHYHEYHCCKNPNGVSLKETRKPYPPTRKSRICTDETKQKLKNLWKSEDYRRKQKDSINKRKQEGTLGSKHTEETKQKLRELRNKILRENPSKNNLRRKSYEFNGDILDSQYEVKVASELLKNGIKYEAKPHYLEYTLNGTSHLYFPDFYLPDYNVYLDPKNSFLISEGQKRLGISDKEKIELVAKQNNVRIVILDKDHLEYDKFIFLL